MIRLSLIGVRVEVPTNQPIVLLREEERHPLPADLHRLARGHRDRLRAAGPGDAAADDARPVQDRARRPVGQARPGRDHRAARRHLLRRDRARPRRREVADLVPALRRDRARGALRRRIPIFADEDVLDEAGVLFEADEEEQEVEQFREFLDEVTPEDFAQ